MGIATKHSFKIQGAQNRVTREKVKDVKRIPALKTSSSILELMYSAVVAMKRVTKERVSILLFLLWLYYGAFSAAKTNFPANINGNHP